MTKAIATGSLMAELALDAFAGDFAKLTATRVAGVLPELKGSLYDATTVGQLWEHRSGAPASFPCFDPPRAPGPRDRESLRGHLLRHIPGLGLETPGETLYSDIGFLLLGCWLERVRGQSLDALWSSWKKKHGLPASSLTYTSAGRQAVPTETRHPAGIVNDDKAASLHGVAPHSGLFGTAAETLAWIRTVWTWQDECPALKTWMRAPEGHGRFHLGWDTPSFTPVSQAGAHAPRGTVGHLGYTGTAFWFHRESQKAGVLLSNRVHPVHSAESQAVIRSLRKQFFDALWEGTLDEQWLGHI
jgi:CubicO group peptidase (beta-lactamase class C family)